MSGHGKSRSAFFSVPPIQTVKGRGVFFRAEREKISTQKSLTVWLFAVALTAGFCGAARPVPPALFQEESRQ